MTTQYLSDWDELAEAQRARRSAQARVAAALVEHAVPLLGRVHD